MAKAKSNQARLSFVLFIVYLLFLVWIILLKMQFSFNIPNTREVNLIPFTASVNSETIQNVLIFIPFGMYLGMIKIDWSFGKKFILIAGVSLSLELLQFIFAIGVTDSTDFICNTFGGLVGIGFYTVCSKILKGKTDIVLNILALIGTLLVIRFLVLLITGDIKFIL